MSQILFVEDDALIRMWVEEALTDAGHAVSVAQDADEAIVLLEADPSIRILLTDIDMPGSMDGLQLAAVVKDRWPPVKLIIASGKHLPAKAQMPADAIFLPKPFLAADIFKALE